MVAAENLVTKARGQLHSYVAAIDEGVTPHIPGMGPFLAATGLARNRVSAGLAVCTALFVVFGIGTASLTSVLGFAYPTYRSFKALKTADDRDDNRQWLTYWVVFGSFNVLETLAGFLTALIPFYFVLKVLFLAWMMHPSTRGATVLYARVLLPLLLRWETRIDDTLEHASEHVSGAAGTLVASIVENAARHEEHKKES